MGYGFDFHLEGWLCQARDFAAKKKQTRRERFLEEIDEHPKLRSFKRSSHRDYGMLPGVTRFSHDAAE
jgi:hypothetical protein